MIDRLDNITIKPPKHNSIIFAVIFSPSAALDKNVRCRYLRDNV
jgi:hypothetical protein